MSDIFISYAKEDKEKAGLLAKVFEQQGWAVWWDPKIPSGKSWPDVIEEALSITKCVVALWSETSRESKWVKKEARYADQRSILVPVLIENVEVPFEFDHLQAALLFDWKGQEPTAEIDKLIEDVGAVLKKFPDEIIDKKTVINEKKETKHIAQSLHKREVVEEKGHDPRKQQDTTTPVIEQTGSRLSWLIPSIVVPFIIGMVVLVLVKKEPVLSKKVSADKEEVGSSLIPKTPFQSTQEGEPSILEIGTKIARAVCFLRYQDGGKNYVATGFMLNSSLMMTNNHVFPSAKVAKTGQAIFNYQKDKDVQLEQSVNYSVNPDRFFITNKVLDFTIVAVDGKPGDKYGTVQLLSDGKKVGIGDYVHLIHHPNGKPKPVMLYSNKVTDFTQVMLKYKTDTMSNSSGSPVFNDLWQLVALHHVRTSNHNEGIRISAILEYLVLRSQEGNIPMLSGLLDSIPDSKLGFFGMVGMTSVSGNYLEKVVLNCQVTDGFVDIGYWNIEHFNNNTSHERIEVVASFIENLRLDVFGLSEISIVAMDRLINVLKGRGLNYRFDFENVQGRQDLAILYDANVVKVGALKFSSAHNRLLKEKIQGKSVFPSLPMQRKVTVKRGNVSRSFVMMVVHLKAFGDQLSRERRRRAAEILRQIIDEQIGKGITDYVVGGDMNEVLGQGAFAALAQGDELIALTVDAASGGGAVSWIGGSNKSLIDNVFVSNDALKTTVTDSITVTRLDKSIPNFDATLSDHIPVIFRALFGNEPIGDKTDGTVF